MKLTAENFAELCPDCFVEYRPIIENKIPIGYRCIGTGPVESEQGAADKKADIYLAEKAGCKGIIEICDWLNGRR